MKESNPDLLTYASLGSLRPDVSPLFTSTFVRFPDCETVVFSYLACFCQLDLAPL